MTCFLLLFFTSYADAFSREKVQTYHQKWSEQLEFDQVDLVYASQNISNPASIMGHLFLKFKKKSRPDLLSWTVSYIASVPANTNIFEYIWNGISGGFEGKYIIRPYYLKVKEYSDFNQRGIWEYELKIPEEKKKLFLDKLWLKYNVTHRPYYFFDENCSMLPIWALGAIYPDLKLEDNLPMIVTPLDVIKLLNQNNLIIKEVYRPSMQEIVAKKYLTLSLEERKRVARIIENNKIDEQINDGELDLLVDFVAYKKNSLDSLKEEVLLRRSKKPSRETITNNIKKLSPLQFPSLAHLDFEYGLLDNRALYSIRYRPGIHRLTDGKMGYVNNSTLSFLETVVTHYNNRVNLSRVTFLKFQSLPTSYRLEPLFSYGILMEYDSGIWDRERSYIEGQAGKTWRLLKNLYITTMTSLTLNWLHSKDSVGCDLGLNGKIIWDISRKIRSVSEVKIITIFQDSNNDNQVNASSNLLIMLGKNYSLHFKAQYLEFIKSHHRNLIGSLGFSIGL